MLTKKQKTLYFILCIILLIIGICIGMFINIKEKEVDKPNIKEPSINDKEKEPEKEIIKKQLYFSEKGRKIYLYDIDRVTVNKQSLTIQNNIWEIISNLTKEYKLLETYKDGGSKLYQTNEENRVDDKINMLVCNTLDGNMDVYFGKTDMKYKDDFCKTNTNDIFTKTYHVLNILDLDTDEAKYLVLRQFQLPESTAIVKVSTYLLPDIKENDPYEFTFQYTDNLLKDTNTKSIFENTELLEIKKTDKLGLEQINDIIDDKYLEKNKIKR